MSNVKSSITYLISKTGRLYRRILQERWEQIPGYEGTYSASDFGQIRSELRKGRIGKSRILRPVKHKSGQREDGSLKFRNSYRLYDGTGGYKNCYGAHLVLMAFGGQRPAGKVACHWNDEPSDDRRSNLRWDSQKNNLRDRIFTSRSDVRTLEDDYREVVIGEAESTSD